MSIGGHHSHTMGKDEWLTPPHVLATLGTFDLDPCAPIKRPWDTAREHYTVLDDGLSKPWSGRVWCNPPYGANTIHWLRRLAAHGQGIALVFARTETYAWVSEVWAKASAVLFIAGRLHFHHVDGTRAHANAGGPSALVAYGEADAEVLRTCDLPGAFVRIDANSLKGRP